MLAYTFSVSVLTLAFTPLVAAWPHIASWFRLGVAVWLAYLAFDAFLRSSKRGTVHQGRETPKLFVTTLFNPKALVLAFGILNTGPEPLENLLNLPVVWAAATAAGWLWLSVGRFIRRGKMRIAFQRVTSTALLGFAIYLGASG